MGVGGGLRFPFEFRIVGTPLSLAGGRISKARWKGMVQEAARDRIRRTVEFAFIDERPIALAIYYFPSAPMIGDVDNIIKPIMDALKGVACPDDRYVERVLAQKFEPSVAWEFTQPTGELAAALDIATSSDPPTPVVYVRVDDDLSWRTLR